MVQNTKQNNKDLHVQASYNKARVGISGEGSWARVLSTEILGVPFFFEHTTSNFIDTSAQSQLQC